MSRLSRTLTKLTRASLLKLGESALKLSDERVGIALERIAVAVGVQAAGTAAATQLLSLDQAPADGKLIELVDVPVEFQSCLIALGVDVLVTVVIVEVDSCFSAIFWSMVRISFACSVFTLELPESTP